MCFNCGFMSSSYYKKDTVKEAEGMVKLVDELKTFDEERQIWWYPSVLNMGPKGIIFPEGNLSNWVWRYAKVVEVPKEEQEQSLKNLMAEFTQNAPEYEGVDKGLAIAKIGFAMAAGQSDSAITNIATALSDGADMFIKDKKDRDAFDRQIQLSALQYGLG